MKQLIFAAILTATTLFGHAVAADGVPLIDATKELSKTQETALSKPEADRLDWLRNKRPGIRDVILLPKANTYAVDSNILNVTIRGKVYTFISNGAKPGVNDSVSWTGKTTPATSDSMVQYIFVSRAKDGSIGAVLTLEDGDYQMESLGRYSVMYKYLPHT